MKKVMNWILAAILVFGAMTALTSCSNDDKVVELDQEGYAGMPLIIYDTDIGSSTDDLYALEMLYRRLLAAQPDHSVSIVSVGFLTCLAQLLASGAVTPASR